MNFKQQAALDQPEYALWKRIARSNLESGIVESIKALRKEFGMGLKEAKDVVELYRNKTSAGRETVSHVRISDEVSLEVTRKPHGTNDIRVMLYQELNLPDSQLLDAIVRLTKEYGGD